MSKITNINDLRATMINILEKVAAGEIPPSAANSAANMCGKVLGSVKIELEHNKMLGLQPNIDFLDGFALGKKNQMLDHNPETGEIEKK